MKKIIHTIIIRIKENKTYRLALGACIAIFVLLILISLPSKEEAQSILAPYNATVNTVMVKTGQEVKQGETILLLNTESINSTVDNNQKEITLEQKIELQTNLVEENKAREREAMAEHEFYTNEEARYALARRVPNISQEDYKKNRSAELEFQSLKNNAKAKLETISLARAESEKELDLMKFAMQYEDVNAIMNPEPEKVEVISNKTFEYLAPYDGIIDDVLVGEGDKIQADIPIITIIPVVK